MEQKRNTEIWWESHTEQQRMTPAEIYDFVQKRMEQIRNFFKWENHPKEAEHLVVAAMYEDTECIIYPYGMLFTDKEFQEQIVCRKDLKIERVWAYHKGTAKF